MQGTGQVVSGEWINDFADPVSIFFSWVLQNLRSVVMRRYAIVLPANSVVISILYM